MVASSSGSSGGWRSMKRHLGKVMLELNLGRQVLVRKGNVGDGWERKGVGREKIENYVLEETVCAK